MPFERAVASRQQCIASQQYQQRHHGIDQRLELARQPYDRGLHPPRRRIAQRTSQIGEGGIHAGHGGGLPLLQRLGALGVDAIRLTAPVAGVVAAGGEQDVSSRLVGAQRPYPIVAASPGGVVHGGLGGLPGEQACKRAGQQDS